LSAGADRRVIGTWAMLQALFPLAAFLFAAWLPRLLFVHRRGLA
jgi:putative thiamine transport system permease protein